jgi:hypothetical protein
MLGHIRKRTKAEDPTSKKDGVGELKEAKTTRAIQKLASPPLLSVIAMIVYMQFRMYFVKHSALQVLQQSTFVSSVPQQLL